MWCMLLFVFNVGQLQYYMCEKLVASSVLEEVYRQKEILHIGQSGSVTRLAW